MFNCSNRFDPVIPAEIKLVTIDESVAVFVEHLEYLLGLLVRNNVNVAFVISEQGTAYQHEFAQWQ